MTEAFRVALSGRFRKADGASAYPDFDLAPLQSRPDIEVVQLAPSDPIAPDQIRTVDALLLAGETFAASSIAPDSRLSLIVRFGVGYDKVDVDACTANGIALAITPDAVRRPVAVAIITFMLALTSKMFVKDGLVRKGADGFARRSEYNGVGLVGRTLGSIGIGNIGAEMFRLARPFDMRFIAHDPYADKSVARSLGVELVGLQELFREADILTINCPLTQETRHLVGRSLLGVMKPTAYIINTARGPIVDQEALVEALASGRMAGAGLDVLEREPPDPDDPILSLDNVILAPHALGWTDQCFATMGQNATAAIFALMRGEAPAHIVNRAIVDQPDWQQALHRYRGAYA